MTMSRIKISYEKVYTDDSGKFTQDIFGKLQPVAISYKLLWNNIVDGFFICKNSDLIIMVNSGSIRIVVNTGEIDGKPKFEQYFLSEFDGKVIFIPSGVKYAIQNMDEGKSGFFIGSYVTDMDFEYHNKHIFNWRKKNP